MDFNFNEDYLLEDDRVLMRPLQLSDFQNLVEFSQNEPDLWQYSLQNAAGIDGLATYLKVALKGRSQFREYPFIVFDKASQQYAGCTRFYDILPDNLTMNLGYTWYGKSFHGTGLNKHCKYLLLRFAFENAGVQRVELRADKENIRSIAAMQSIGCKQEGILRSNMKTIDGRRRDSVVFSILKHEWFNEVKPMLGQKLSNLQQQSLEEKIGD